MGETAIRRGFVDLPEGQIHYRTAGQGGSWPLVLLHASPGSSRALDALTVRLAKSRLAIAPDTPGNGDSAPLVVPSPTIADFASRLLSALAALGLDAFDLYGTHTGAGIAAEIAIAAPQRVHRLVLDGVGLYSDDDVAEMLDRYAPALEPDLEARYVMWVWHFVRDTYSFWPWYHRDSDHARTVGLPPVDVLHDKFVDVLKATRTYHLSYRASIAQRKRERFPLIRVPTLVACARNDMLFRWQEEVVGLIPGAEKAITSGIVSAEAADGTARQIATFLDRQ